MGIAGFKVAWPMLEVVALQHKAPKPKAVNAHVMVQSQAVRLAASPETETPEHQGPSERPAP